MSALTGLTDAQREAASYVEGPALVVAGPGSGKTRTLLARLGYLIESGQARPEELLAVTFTRKAAGELRARLLATLGPLGQRVVVGTFHGVSLLLRPLPEGTVLLGEADRLMLAKGIVETLARAPWAGVSKARPLGEAAAEKLVETVSRLKGQRCDWDAGLSLCQEPPWLEPAVRAYKQWQEAISAEDLDDLLIAATQAVKSGTARRFRFVLVDEYQDVNGVQRELLCALYQAGARLFAIGDPDQAIYAFRGAEVAHFHAFATDFPGTRMFFLRDNFRATATLCDAATAVIERNADRLQSPAFAHGRPRAARPGGERLVFSIAPSAMSEAIAIARQIENLVGGTSLSSHDQGRTAAWAAGRYAFSDIAVLTRTVARADRIAEALAHEGVPILRPRRSRLFGPPSPVLLSRLIACGLGGQQVHAPGGCETPHAQDEENAPAIATQPDSTLSEVGLSHESDAYDACMQRVAVLTLHGSKGLEFPVVFLCGCEAELLPGLGAEAATICEERRLFYVGLTRAKDLLYLSSVADRPLSPFLDELPAAAVYRAAPPPRKPKSPQLKLF